MLEVTRPYIIMKRFDERKRAIEYSLNNRVKEICFKKVTEWRRKKKSRNVKLDKNQLK